MIGKSTWPPGQTWLRVVAQNRPLCSTSQGWPTGNLIARRVKATGLTSAGAVAVAADVGAAATAAAGVRTSAAVSIQD